MTLAVTIVYDIILHHKCHLLQWPMAMFKYPDASMSTYLFILNFSCLIFVLLKYKLTVADFLAEHGQQHSVVRKEQLVDAGSFKQGAENLQQLVEETNNTFLGSSDLHR